MKIIIFLLFSSWALHCQSLKIPEKFRNLREKVSKGKNLIQKVVIDTKRGAAKFVRRSNILFPGLDEEKLKKVKEFWQEYYDCQKAFYEASQRMIVPQALAFVESSNTVLECELCQSPREIFLEIVWLYSAKYDMDDISAVQITPTVCVRNGNLHINNIMVSRAGLYVCRKGNHYSRPYIVHVFTDEPSKLVVPPQNPEGDHPTLDVAIPGLDLTVTTQWSEWTLCSRCNHVGKRYLHGICTIVSDKYMPGLREKQQKYLPDSNNQSHQVNKKRSILSSSTSTSPKTEQELHNKTEYQAVSFQEQYKSSNSSSENSTTISFSDDLTLLDIFEEGIPCRSEMLSIGIRKLEIVANRSSEVMVSYCKLECPKNVIFMAMDENGTIIETANNSAGIYSVLQGLPMDFPIITRTVQFAVNGKHFKIQCPGYRKDDIPVEWYIGRKAVTNKVLVHETKGRVKIDEYNRIVFDPALLEDSRVFSCWQHWDLVGTVRLIVEKEHSLRFDYPIMAMGTILTLGMFLYVYYVAFTTA